MSTLVCYALCNLVEETDYDDEEDGAISGSNLNYDAYFWGFIKAVRRGYCGVSFVQVFL